MVMFGYVYVYVYVYVFVLTRLDDLFQDHDCPFRVAEAIAALDEHAEAQLVDVWGSDALRPDIGDRLFGCSFVCLFVCLFVVYRGDR